MTQWPLTDWPTIASAIARDPALEARVAAIVSGMTLEQKVGQMTQPEIGKITPAEVTRHYIGSVLNGGGSWPGGDKRARLADWLKLAEQLHDASMATDMRVPVPLIWGTDAVHGHNNVYGATVFPHHIGLGAAHDAPLVERVAQATARAVRASGIGWVFAPTLAVARDDRWGRTYESFSEDAALVQTYAAAYVRGLQGRFADDGNVVATAKHFIGDGGTEFGRDQGINPSTLAEMINIHGRGYYGALGAGAQTVMASFNSWNDVAAGVDHGKLHGSRALLTDVLKTKMGFDGFVVSDWNGIGQVPGCSNASCAQAINAGIDMVMVPEDWKAFITHTVAQVRSGQIPMARIDDAVTRILRVKMRAGLFGQRPSSSAHAGREAALQARELAREAVRKSLVLLKNDGGVLPLARGQRILVVGKGADSLQNQTGGWTLGWQGTDNANADFPAGDTLLAGIAEAAGAGKVVFSADAKGVDVAAFAAVIAVVGETPYAEGNGDITPSGTLRHSGRHPEDLAVLNAVAGKGRPVVTVLLSGRPLWVNDLLNRSDAFVAAWLPGTEGKGVADVLFKPAAGGTGHDFTGRLSFSWPRAACQTPLNAGDAGDAPLFALGHGLSYAGAARAAPLGRLDEATPESGCGAPAVLQIFNTTVQPPYTMHVASLDQRWPDTGVPTDPNAVLELPGLRVTTVQINTQQDAKRVAWAGPARLVAWSAQRAELATWRDAALVFELRVEQAPADTVTLAMGCTAPCGALDLTALLRHLPLQARHSLKIPLACFAAAGVDLSRVDTPFILATRGTLTAAVAHIRIAAGAAKDADATPCVAVPPRASL
ncbi:MAG: glycoside hydrolase family 3 N-terminal domain-containing protein [Rubrivivax sp.]|nr:glycoside hydrolase family 3 N-terminal domain-containing protein [Rubrivivax sp.]